MGYMGNSSNSLLVSLYESVHGKKVQDVGKKYFEDTNTMYHEAQRNNASISARINEQAIKEFLLEPDEYKAIIQGRVHYLIVDRVDFIIGEEIVIKEVEGLLPTGRTLYRHILDIKTMGKGLEDGYTIISF